MRRAALLALVLALAWARPASARSEKTVAWPAADVYPAAVRFLRIDVGVKIVEKDADDGYVLFELDEDHRTFRGALELVRVKDDGRDAVKLILRIDDRPSYEEEALLDKLTYKLRRELGRPPDPPPAQAPKKAPRRAGDGGGSSDDGGTAAP
jgi:hypothetical protein